MITSQNRNAVLKAHLQANQEGHCLDRIITSVNIVAHEQVICVWRSTSNLEQFHEVVELAMDVTADRDWALDWLHIHLCL